MPIAGPPQALLPHFLVRRYATMQTHVFKGSSLFWSNFSVIHFWVNVYVYNMNALSNKKVVYLLQMFHIEISHFMCVHA